MLHDSDGERRFQVVKSACHLSCAVTVLVARRADLVKYLNWFVDLLIVNRRGCEGRQNEKRETEQESLQFMSIYCDNIDCQGKANLSCVTCPITNSSPPRTNMHASKQFP